MTDTFIRAVAAEVKGHDKKFEETLREREKSNPKYKFLLRRDVGHFSEMISFLTYSFNSIGGTRITEVLSNLRSHLNQPLMMRYV